MQQRRLESRYTRALIRHLQRSTYNWSSHHDALDTDIASYSPTRSSGYAEEYTNESSSLSYDTDRSLPSSPTSIGNTVDCPYDTTHLPPSSPTSIGNTVGCPYHTTHLPPSSPSSIGNTVDYSYDTDRSLPFSTSSIDNTVYCPKDTDCSPRWNNDNHEHYSYDTAEHVALVDYYFKLDNGEDPRFQWAIQNLFWNP